MKKEYLFILFPLMILLPLPFVWYGYGEKGVYGYAMLSDLFFLGGWLLILTSRLRVFKYLKGVGQSFVAVSYGYGAIRFCRHIPVDLAPIDICRFPMWISFIGTLGLFFAYWYCFEKDE